MARSHDPVARVGRKRAAGDECYTPALFVRAARDVLGVIDLDPASCEAAQAVVRARRHFTAAHDGLRRKWRGRVWLNPPYSRPLPWARKLLASYHAREVLEAVALFNSRTGSRWFDELAAHAWRCETRRRIRFWGPGTSGGNGMQDQVFFYLGPSPARFAAVFAPIGRIVPPSSSHELGGGGACGVCGRALSGLRADAETCSNACRQKRYRARVRST